MITRVVYTLLLYCALPYVLLRLLWRARRQPGYLEHVAERFGRYGARADGPTLWLHAVSVGETRAAEPLIRALSARYPDHRILLTHMTPTGRETGEQLYGDRVMRGYLPYDFPGAVARFLDHFQPKLGVLMETELWPNLIHACRERGVPVHLVNARLSEKSLAGYLRFPGITRAALGGLAAVAAQTGEDAARLSNLGAANVVVTGNVKFDIAPSHDKVELGRAWRGLYGKARPVLLAASTRDGEEALVLDALDAIEAPGLLTVIVPRHPQRFEEVAALLAARRFRFQRRSENAVIAPDTQIVLGDSMGEMFAYYAACDVAFVGGSLLPLGGQNLIEACAVGKPVVVGPSTYNFAEAVQGAVAAGAAVQVRDTADLARVAGRLLLDREAARRMAQAALVFANVHRGATARVLELIQL
ncbi:MAG: 3-deoxy-D-manno-octulosonic acid transferase [Betaproteobacteria bacterium]|nr:3-deoxy-D-manno-octulosonic acid transferase [Betaproteobacteria bacterium]